MTKSIITRVVRCDDISQLLLMDRLRLAVVLLLQLVHHGNYAVEPFGHAGPHPVLKGRNAPLVVRFLLIMCFPGCNCDKKKMVQAAQRLFSYDFGAQNNTERFFFPGFMFKRSTGNCRPDGPIFLTKRLDGFQLSLSVPELHLFADELMPLHSVYVCECEYEGAHVRQSVRPRPVSGWVYFGCFRHMA